jgi:pimeloyl-ACP methyl ester carboxylesterase
MYYMAYLLTGGAVSLMTFSKRLQSAKYEFSPRFPIALVLDSAPNPNSMKVTVDAVVTTIRPMLQLPARALLTLIYFAFYVSYGRPEGYLAETCQFLNKDGLIPFASIPSTMSEVEKRQWIPRLYICSDADTISPLQYVLAHAEEAKKLGYEVRTEVFDNSPHVSHARTDGDRYWKAVDQLWSDAGARKPRARL